MDIVQRAWLRRVVSGVFVAVTCVWGVPYVLGFIADAGSHNTRRAMAESLANDTSDLQLVAEPAPYSCPPVNIFNRRLLLVDEASMPIGSRTLFTMDKGSTPISWASKRFGWIISE